MSESSSGQPSSAVLQGRLANERTLLAWVRTAVSLMGFGVVVARLGVALEGLIPSAQVNASAAQHSRWTGAILLLVGSVITLIGHSRTRAYAKKIDPAQGPPGDGPLTSLAALVALLGVVLAGLVLFIS